MIHGIDRGQGTAHDTGLHQVTSCIHTHSAEKEKSQAGQAAKAALQETAEEASGELAGGFSLSSFWKSILSGTKRLVHGIWQDGGTDSGQAGSSPSADVLLQKGEVMAAPLVQSHQTVLQSNPYFTASVPVEKRQGLLERVRVRFHSVSKYLTKHFSGKNSFQARQERPKEDLRRHSRYRQDDLEIECVLTDDSYLLDSYDKQGEYSRLSTKNSRK